MTLVTNKVFLKAVKTACERNPDEARSLLSGLFPQGMDTKDYYEYLLKKDWKDRIKKTPVRLKQKKYNDLVIIIIGKSQLRDNILFNAS
jgi:hypothetical protein